MDIETIIYIIIVVVFVIIRSLSSKQDQQKKQQPPAASPPKNEPNELEGLPDDLKKYFEDFVNEEEDETITEEEHYEETNEQIFQEPDYAYIDTPQGSVEDESVEEHKTHFIFKEEKKERAASKTHKTTTNIKIDLKQAIIYQAILERKYS